MTVRGYVRRVKHWIDYMVGQAAANHSPSVACLKTPEELCKLMLQPSMAKAFDVFYRGTSQNNSIMTRKKKGQVKNEYAYQPAGLNALLALLGLKRRRKAGANACLDRVGPCWRPEPEEEDEDGDDEEDDANQGRSSSEEEEEEDSSSELDEEEKKQSAAAAAAKRKTTKRANAADLAKGWNRILHADLVKLIVKSLW